MTGGKVRAEFEYFYRTTTYNDRTGARVGDEVSLGKIDQEIETVEGGLDDVLSHNFFGNLYYDFTSKSRFTPYLGIGVGVAPVSLDYSSRWKRNDNPDFITTFVDRDLNAKLAGTTTIGTAKLSDRVLGYQVLGGGDYKVNDSISVGIKFRWADFAEFMDGAEWDQLRSHDSTNDREDLVIIHRHNERHPILGDQLQHEVPFRLMAIVKCAHCALKGSTHVIL